MRYTNIKILIRTVLYLSIATVVFLNIVNLMQFPTNGVKDNTKQTELIKEHLISMDNNEAILNEIIGATPSSNYLSEFKDKFVFFDYIFNNNNIVVPLLYIITMLTFLLQATLLSLSNYYKELGQFWSEKELDSFFLYSSEWAINAPPVLGVVGTIFSFGMVVSNLSDMSSLSTVFKDNFANAALTTIIGGSIYVLNLLLNIFIAKNLSK